MLTKHFRSELFDDSDIRSLRNKIDDIVKKKDIVCFTETYLDQRVPTNNLVIPGFNSNPFRLDRNTYNDVFQRQY